MLIRATLVIFVVPALSTCAAPCAGVVDVFTVDGTSPETPTVTEASATAVEAVISSGAFNIRFNVVDGSPPELPSGGPEIVVGEGDCSGEGCGESFWLVRGVLEVGTVNFLDDRRDHQRPGGTHLSVRYPADRAVCDDGGSDSDAALAVIRTDGGDVVLAPGETARVVIDGANFQAEAGHAGRSSSFQLSPFCADCAGPGSHSDTHASAVLYRIAE